MGLMAYHRPRLDALRVAMSAALGELQGIRSDDGAAADAMRSIVEACRVLGDRCLPRVRDILDSDPLTSRQQPWLDSCAFRETVSFQLVREFTWELASDPLESSTEPPPRHGPFAPWARTYDDVMTAIQCGELVPMAVPLDEHRPSKSQITTVSFAPRSVEVMASEEVTSNLLRAADLGADVLPFGWREDHEQTVYYLPSVAITSTVMVFDPISHAPFPPHITQAQASGFMVVRDETRDVEVSLPFGGAPRDPTMSIAIRLDRQHDYQGAFYPLTAVEFRPAPSPATSDDEPRWQFMSRHLPLINGYGTWRPQ